MSAARPAALAAVLAATAAAVAIAAPAQQARPRVLVFTKTAGFRHDSIPAAVRAVRELAAEAGLGVDATEDAAMFTPSRLRRYRAVVFLLTTGDVLNGAQQRAFEQYIRRGGGFAGVHSATDTEYGWAWYGRLVGSRFRSHPQVQDATVRVAGRRDPSTAGLPSSWRRSDEWYNFAPRPRGVTVLARVDERTYAPGDGAMGADHPIAWSHRYAGGRAWYTAGGHGSSAYDEPLFRRHLLGGIRYASGLSPPSIVAVASAVRRGRLSLTVRYRSCTPCAGHLVVPLRRRAVRTRLALRGGVGQASIELPSGRWRVAVVLRDPLSSLAATARRTISVP